MTTLPSPVPLGREHPEHTYAYNRRIRRLANQNGDFNPNFGKPIGGGKSLAHLARVERRKASRLKAKKQAEDVRQHLETLRAKREQNAI